tara:strand:- start:44 stop:301 length:258 start_codon:yes stop_codon:yes gene_type:complete
MKIEEFYNSLPWQVKENAKFPLNYSRLSAEQELLVGSLFDYEQNNDQWRFQVDDIISDTNIIAAEMQEVVDSIEELQESLKRVVK